MQRPGWQERIQNTSCGLFLWHLWTQPLASLPFGNELAMIWRLACFQQPQGSSVLQGTLFCFCWDGGIKPELLHVRFPSSTSWPALLFPEGPQLQRQKWKKWQSILEPTADRQTGTEASLYLLKRCSEAGLKSASFSEAHHRGALKSYQERQYSALQHFHKENQGNPQANTNTLTHEVMIHQSLALQKCWELVLKTAAC